MCEMCQYYDMASTYELEYAQRIDCFDSCTGVDEYCWMSWDDADAGSGRASCDDFFTQFPDADQCPSTCYDLDCTAEEGNEDLTYCMVV
jgi:hypothetical protein